MFVAPPEKEVEWTRLRPGRQLPLAGARVADCRAVAVGDGRRRAGSRQLGRRRDKIDHGALSADERAIRRKTHETIRRVTQDIDVRKQMNTAVSAMMELVNDLYAFTDKGQRTAAGRAGGRARRSRRWS